MSPNHRPKQPRQRTSQTLAATFLLAAAILIPQPAHAQGCTQCRDNAAATPPATQRAYRYAIILLLVTGGSLFAATVTILKRNS